MLLELFPFVILNNAMAFVYAYFFSDFLRFDMSLLLLTVTMRGYLISIDYCLFFHLKTVIAIYIFNILNYQAISSKFAEQ